MIVHSSQEVYAEKHDRPELAMALPASNPQNLVAFPKPEYNIARRRIPEPNGSGGPQTEAIPRGVSAGPTQFSLAVGHLSVRARQLTSQTQRGWFRPSGRTKNVHANPKN
jgi:hypothetical protein